MYVNSGGAGTGSCDGDEDEDLGRTENCANDQPVASLLRYSLENVLVENKVNITRLLACKAFRFLCRARSRRND